jgi:uncharacterized protein YprB with RNaseH-like and TPR domain
MNQKILMFDVESTSIYSSSGSVIAIGIFDPQTMKEPFVKVIEDLNQERELLEWFKEKVREYDIICGWNSKSFDLPFILGRALQLNLDLSELKEKAHLDLIEISKENFRFRSNRLEDVCKLLKIPYQREISGEEIAINFMKGLKGNKEAIEKIRKRCSNDVIALAKVFEKFKPYLNFQNNCLARKTTNK